MQTAVQSYLRQIRILSRIVSSPVPLMKPDLEHELRVSHASLERDLKALRANGISIHAHRKKGLCLEDPKCLTTGRLVDIIADFIALSSPQAALKETFARAVSTQQAKALSTFVTITQAINEHKSVSCQFGYPGQEKEKYVLSPYKLQTFGGSWDVYALNHRTGHAERYHPELLDDLMISGEKYRWTENETGETTRWRQFFYSRYPDRALLRAGNAQTIISFEERRTAMYTVKILFDKAAADIVTSRKWIVSQSFKKKRNGSVVFSAEFNDLFEVLRWVLPWGGLAEVLEPKVLKDQVREIAEEIVHHRKPNFTMQ